MTIIENHPFSKLARQIDQYLWASVILTSAVAAVSLMNMGRLSMFVAPCMFMITLAHNFTLLGLASQDRKKSSDKLNNTLAPTSTKANIVICWVLVGLWSLTVVIIIIVSVIIMGMNEFEDWERLAGYIELPMVVAEIFLLVVIARKCVKQRKTSIIQPENVDWQHFGPQV
jgi:hypothetical protein